MVKVRKPMGEQAFGPKLATLDGTLVGAQATPPGESSGFGIPSTEYGGGSGGGGDMNGRITKIEVITENHGRIIENTQSEIRGLRDDIRSVELRIIDKMDENHKWVIGLIISSILVPLFIALVTK